MELTHKRMTDKDRVTMFLEILQHNTVDPIALMRDEREKNQPSIMVLVSSHSLGQAHVLSNAIAFTSVCLHPQYGEDEKGRVVISIT